MKQEFIVKLICLPVLCMCTTIPVKAQDVQSAWHGRISIGDIPILMHGDIALQSDCELFTNDGRLELEGSYRGESGSKAYRYVTGTVTDAGIDASLFLNISGTAGGFTEIIPEFDENWDGSPVSLVKAKQAVTESGTGTDTKNSVFYIEPILPECGDYYVQLLHKGDGNGSVWSVTGTTTLPLIAQLRNHTLLVNNNAATNGGYKFEYYKWYKNGVLLKEGSHATHGGSYYTGGANLDEGANYTVEVTDSAGAHYFSCPYRFVPFAPPINVSVYPNPVPRNAKAYIQAETQDLTLLNDAVVDIYDMMGLYAGKAKISGQTLTPLDLPGKSGIYVLKFRAGDFIQTIKLIVE